MGESHLSRVTAPDCQPLTEQPCKDLQSKGTIRFTPDHPLPDDVLEDIVRLRRAEIRK